MEYLAEICAHFGLQLSDEQRDHSFSLSVGLTSVLVAIVIVYIYVFPVTHS